MTNDLVEDSTVIEAEANRFAVSLLMPADMVRLEVRKLGGIDIEDDRKKIAGLARKFGVSVQLMTMRLGQLLL